MSFKKFIEEEVQHYAGNGDKISKRQFNQHMNNWLNGAGKKPFKGKKAQDKTEDIKESSDDKGTGFKLKD